MRALKFDVRFTPDVIKHVKRIQDQKVHKVLGLRISLEGGGCEGMQYRFNLSNQKSRDDYILIQHGVAFIVDQFSCIYLSGSVVDLNLHEESLGFTVFNPNASVTCHCGSSFRSYR
jgi:iron-sulfur cluster assembly accessory protein